MAFAFFLGGFVANYQWPAFPDYLKIALWLFLAIVILALIGFTKKGLVLFRFSKDARAELRKVHWPTRQETLQTTLMVVVMVVVVGLFLWGVDALFIWAVNGLTGQRG
ncbi:MAG: preprotein translocase subunit SecE [Gammaproteobacteria bacterium]|nr:preprotein translocase subunit SecE [Gammaproteobacteria bacterium]